MYHGELTSNLFLMRMRRGLHRWNTGLQYGKIINTVYYASHYYNMGILFFMAENVT